MIALTVPMQFPSLARLRRSPARLIARILTQPPPV